MQSSVRRALFAGSWYPARASECERQIKAFIDQGHITPPRNPNPVGGIVPHAGWTFSGSIACNVIHCLKQAGPPGPDVIVLFGMHLHRGSANIMMPTGGWETPFGVIPVQEDLAAAIAQRFAFRLETPARFTEDNTIELQLPFIKYFFPDAAIVAMGVPPTQASLAIGNAVVDTARQLGLSVKVIGSTDLTHYGDNYGLASHGTGPAAVAWVRQENDRRVIEAMLGLDPERVIDEALKNQNACCPGAAATAIQAGKHLGATVAESITYATSYDRSPGDSFVGYVGIVF
jgi:AmmeMemoRadiSam system protein B